MSAKRDGQVYVNLTHLIFLCHSGIGHVSSKNLEMRFNKWWNFYGDIVFEIQLIQIQVRSFAVEDNDDGLLGQ